MEEVSFGESQRYSKLSNKTRRRTNNAASIHNGFVNSNISPPLDSYNAVYLSFVLGGAGFLLPYNSFIMAMDYFKIRYPEAPIVFDISLVYIAVAFLTVLGNNVLVETCSLNSRINFGYLISFVTLMFVVVCEVWWEAFGSATSYGVNLLAVAVVAVGCTIQQSSFYGYTGMLPPRYTQAVMVGESASGVFTSSVRVLTRFLVPEIRGSTIYFFTVSVSAVATCFTIYHVIKRTDFVQFYMALCERAKTRITLEPTEDAGLIETNDLQYGVLKIQSSPPPTESSALSFANPAYEPTASVDSTAPPVPTYKVEDVVLRNRHQSLSTAGGGLGGIKRGLLARWEITKAIYPYMISICLVYFATLCLYPGIASEIVSCRLGTWMPILMMALFNGADLFGKMLASSSKYWTEARLVRCSVARLVMIPLTLMCVAPRASPVFSAEVTAFAFALILGFSNGVLGSVPMIKASGSVEDRHRELTGNMMTLLYNFGLTTGSLMAYCIEASLSPKEEHPCSTHLPLLGRISSEHPLNVSTLITKNVITSTVSLVASTMTTTTVSSDNFSISTR